MSKIKILYITTSLNIGGAEMMLCHLLTRLDRNHFEPVVISLSEKSKLDDRITVLGIPLFHLGMRSDQPKISILLRLMHIVRITKPDLIQGWMYHANLVAQLLGSFLRIPVLWSVHSSVYNLAHEKRTTAWVIRACAFLSKQARKIIFVSETSRQQHEQLGYEPSRSCVIANGFDTSLFAPSHETRLRVRAALNIPDDAMLIGSFARFHPMKDHANFLRAAGELAHRYPQVQFLLAGTDVTWENPAIRQLVTELSLQDRTHLLGPRYDVPDLMKSLDLMTSSSAYSEAFPLVIGEAMACGVPCVATNLGDSTILIGDTGLVVPPQNSQELAGAWESVIAAPTEQRYQLGRAARQRIEQNYSLQSIVTQYERLYLSIAGK